MSLTYNGVTQTAAAWARQRDMRPTCLHDRLHRLKWTLGQALGYDPPPSRGRTSPPREAWTPRKANPPTPDAGMRWCPTHGMAWYPGPTDAGWIPFSRAKLQATLALLRDVGCSEVVRVVETPCAQCAAAEVA